MVVSSTRKGAGGCAASVARKKAGTNTSSVRIARILPGRSGLPDLTYPTYPTYPTYLTCLTYPTYPTYLTCLTYPTLSEQELRGELHLPRRTRVARCEPRIRDHPERGAADDRGAARRSGARLSEVHHVE